MKMTNLGFELCVLREMPPDGDSILWNQKPSTQRCSPLEKWEKVNVITFSSKQELGRGYEENVVEICIELNTNVLS
jgi:hypothetical protein